MTERDAVFESAHEIGKIYQSLLERKSLCLFFLESASKFIAADEGFLYLLGNQNRIWLDSRVPDPGTASPEFLADLEKRADEVLRRGKPVHDGRFIFLPLLSRNSALGVAAFVKSEKAPAFEPQDLDLAVGLGFQMAGALKNIMLFEENLRMERLAAVGQTTGMVIHEIKNIMQLAKLSYEFIARGLAKKKDEFIVRGAANMEKALKELEGFTMDMLSLTKDYELDLDRVDMAALFKELQESLLDKAKDLRVALEFKASPELDWVDCDRRAVYRTLLNLIKNAMEATDPKRADSAVRVTAEPLDAERYVLKVEDNGIGMTAEVKARLFEAFFSTKGQKGTGLGLLIIDRTVKKHQGEIQIESELGKGTTFILTMPRKIARSAPNGS
ncbi:MAG TPA: ATP-binding protein [Verrucomicrobiae bacterium]|jgi:signal transduction histidine kinase|nr:ATP-binding protein [Verrucomicrobiae bacterium]